MNMDDSIDNYIVIKQFNNGKVKPIECRTKIEKQGNVYKKLASFNISYYDRNKFIQRKEREDLVLSKMEVENIFLSYLRSLDITKYEEKITHDEICTFYLEKNIIRANDLMKEYMEM